jgi:hypothetical protein
MCSTSERGDVANGAKGPTRAFGFIEESSLDSMETRAAMSEIARGGNLTEAGLAVLHCGDRLGVTMSSVRGLEIAVLCVCLGAVAGSFFHPLLGGWE